MLFLNDNIIFRKENFGGIGFNKKSRKYFLFNDEAYEILNYIEKNKGLDPEKIKNIIPNELLTDVKECLSLWKNDEVLSECDNKGFIERPSISYKIKNDILSFPVEVTINPSFKCNQKCSFCSNENILNAPINEMNQENIDKLIDKFYTYGVFKTYFVGGEPLLFKNIRYFIEKLLPYRFDVGLTTNGNIKNRDNLLFFCEKGVMVSVSIQSHISEIHDSLVGFKGAFKETDFTIREIIKNGFSLDLSMILSRNNFSTIIETIKYFYDLGVPSITLLYPFEIGGMEKQKESILNRMEFLDISKKLENISLKYNAKLKSLCRMSFLSEQNKFQIESEEQKMMKKYLGEPGCFLGKKGIVLHPNGDVYPCDFLMFDKKWNIGNILNDNFLHQWENSEIIENLRNLEIPQKCQVCEFYIQCRGGCPATNYIKDNILKFPTKDCPF